MNHYGQQAQTHWAEWLPNRYTTIKDPTEFFSMLGTEIEAEIDSRYQARLATMPIPLSDTAAQGWANMARLMVTDEVLAELAYLTPETDPDDQDLPADPLSANMAIVAATNEGYAQAEEQMEAEMLEDWKRRQASHH